MMQVGSIEILHVNSRLGIGDTCALLIADASQDGLDEWSIYRVLLGTEFSFSDDPAPIPLVDAGGYFGPQEEITFEIVGSKQELSHV